jgi:hypothetical protein
VFLVIAHPIQVKYIYIYIYIYMLQSIVIEHYIKRIKHVWSYRRSSRLGIGRKADDFIL